MATIVLLPFLGKSVWQDRKAILRHWKIFLALSFGLAFMNTFIYQAGHSTSAIDMSLLATTGPIFLIVFSWVLFGKKVSALQVTGFSISFIGVLTVISNGSLSTFTNFQFAAGNWWMIVFAICFGLYGALERKRPTDVKQFTFLAATIFAGTLMLVPFFIGTLDKHPLSDIGFIQWLLMIYLGLFNSIFGYLAWNVALNKIGALKCSLIYYSLPIFSSIWAYFVLKENIGYAELFGALFVFTGIIIGSLKSKKSA